MSKQKELNKTKWNKNKIKKIKIKFRNKTTTSKQIFHSLI